MIRKNGKSMKKILVILLCLILVVSVASCDKENEDLNPEKIQNTTHDSTQESLKTNSQEKEESVNPHYQKAYLDFLKDKKESHRLFSLVFIDGDDIPELYLSGVSEAEGDMICSFKNGVVVYQLLSRIGGVKYVERSGNIINQNGHMGHYYDNVYTLSENGFSQILNARYTERYEHVENEEYNIYCEYFIGDTLVSEADYNTAVSSAFDLSKAVRLDANAVAYNTIIGQLHGDNSVG